MEILIERADSGRYAFQRATNCTYSYLAVLRVLSVALMDLMVKMDARYLAFLAELLRDL